MAPYYSIEAWTYQADQKAIEICRRDYSRRDIEKFEEWARDRSALDEVDKPKEQTCLTNQHNEALASKVPCNEVLATGKSFTRAPRELNVIFDDFGLCRGRKAPNTKSLLTEFGG